ASNIMTSYRIDNDRYQRFGPGQYFTSQFVNYVAVDDDATIWVGTKDKGLYIIEKESTITVTTTMEKYLDCNGTTQDAAFSVRAIGGKPPYQFVWAHGATGEKLFGLGPGKYHLTVTDTEGSSKTAIVEIANPFIQLATVMDHPESDVGMEDGAASVKVTGGVAPYIYEWYSGVGEASITGLSEGDFGVTVTDAAGCSAISTVKILQQVKPLTATIEQKEFIRCAGEGTAVIVAQQSGGKAPYNYRWSNGGANFVFLENVPVGKYTVTVTDALGNTASSSITISQPEAVVATIRIESPASANMNNGVATVQCTGGKPPYQYLWDNGESTLTANKLASRRHTVTVTDASGCHTQAAVDILENILPLNATITQTSGIRCANEATAGLKVEVQGGKTPFSYQWNRNDLQGDELTGLRAGDYVVTITDAAKGTATLKAIIKEPFPIIATTVAETPALTGTNEGHAIVRAEGGTGKLSYLWDNGDSGSKTVSLSAGIHTVTVTDESGCSTTAEVNIIENILAIDLTLQQTGSIQCTGDATAGIIASIKGGKEPYTLTWSNGVQNTKTQESLQAGTYWLSVVDAIGNRIEKEITLKEPIALKLKIEIQSPASANNADGHATARVSGGTTPYNIRWSTGETSPQSIALPAGIHQVTVTDVNGCSTIGSIEITEDILPLRVSISQTSEILCAGQNTGALEASIVGGKSPYAIRWQDQSDIQSRTALPAGIYSIEVTDVSNQKASANFNVNQPFPLSGEIIDVRAATHERLADGKATARISGGNTPYQFRWDNDESSARAVQLSVGMHTVTVTDANGCTFSLSTEIAEKILPELTAENLEKGEAVRMEQLQFDADSTSISASSLPTLEELYNFLSDNPTIVVEIGGHTNGLPEHDYCDRLSTDRAKAVADYIINQGIEAKRLIYKGYGKRQPIATNMTPEGRRRNQRVEVRTVKLSE
ncbi:MAG TPA: OmpA family protein, partial [Saprospiraceae bacterium]|nr:OmpA family protein [Saprospiraceae bacterium]